MEFGKIASAVKTDVLETFAEDESASVQVSHHLASLTDRI